MVICAIVITATFTLASVIDRFFSTEDLKAMGICTCHLGE